MISIRILRMTPLLDLDGDSRSNHGSESVPEQGAEAPHRKNFCARRSAWPGSRSLILFALAGSCARKVKLAPAHVDALAQKPHSLQFEQDALVKPRLARQQYLASAPENPLPGKTASVRAAERPGNLAGRAGMARSSGHRAVGRYLALWYTQNGFPDILEVCHRTAR